MRDLTNADCVVLSGWDQVANLELMAVANRRGVPVALHYGSTNSTHRFKRGLIPMVRRMALGAADVVVTYGRASSDSARGHGVEPSRVVEGFNAVDNQRFKANLDRDPTADGHSFGYVGRLVPIKNVERLIRAFARIRQLGDKLFVVGDGPDMDHLKAVAINLGVFEHVAWLGYVTPDELIPIYGTMRTLVLPSLIVPWGLVANEALASGRQVVISNRCGSWADMRGWKGVYGAEPSIDGIADAMDRSRSDWIGPVLDSEIAGHGIEMSVKTFRQAIASLVHPGPSPPS